MLRVIIQVNSSNGLPATIKVLDIQNDVTGTPEIGNYSVMLVEHDKRGVRKARVENYIRAEGALRLIQKAIEELEHEQVGE